MSAGAGRPAGMAGGLKFWSEASIPGRPRVLAVDVTGNREGWEYETGKRVFSSLPRRDIRTTHADVVTASPADAAAIAAGPADYNALLIFMRNDGRLADGEMWERLVAGNADREALVAICTWDTAAPSLAAAVANSTQPFGRLAVVQESPMTLRAAGLFFMKFFAELDLHSEASDSMTGKMVWFGHSKAREILKRRHYGGGVFLKS